MPPRWSADIEVDLSLARCLISRVAPELETGTTVRFGEGWDNVAYLVEDRWLFRFPRRNIAVACMETEIAVLPALPDLPLPIPRPVFVGRDDEAYPWPYAGYERIAGTPSIEREIDDPTAAASAATLAAFLHALHTVSTAELRARGAREDDLARLDVDTRLPRSLEALERLGDAGELRDPARIRATLESAAEATRVAGPAESGALVHGDLDPRHVLVDAAGAPCGVIDWGDLHLGDPGVDLALYYTYLPPPPSEARAAFRARYGGIREGTLAKARFRALIHSLVILDWALSTSRPRMAAEARRWLARTAAPE